MLKLVDMDGDKALDLVILDGGTDHPIHVRFASDEKKLGPEQRFQVESPRAIAFGQIDGKKGSEILTVEGQSGRGKVLTLDDSATDESNKWGRLVFFGLPQAGDRGRGLAVGDMDGDKRKDVVVTDPTGAQILLYRQSGRSGLNAGQSFPGLLGGRTIRLADLDQDGKDELYVLSEQEKQIGRAALENGRISFPAPLPISGEPVAMDLADLDGDRKPEVVYIARNRSVRRRDVRAPRRQARCRGSLSCVLVGQESIGSRHGAFQRSHSDPGGRRQSRRLDRPTRLHVVTAHRSCFWATRQSLPRRSPAAWARSRRPLPPACP